MYCRTGGALTVDIGAQVPPESEKRPPVTW